VLADVAFQQLLLACSQLELPVLAHRLDHLPPAHRGQRLFVVVRVQQDDVIRLAVAAVTIRHFWAAVFVTGEADDRVVVIAIIVIIVIIVGIIILAGKRSRNLPPVLI
jgi:hypothetical protein